MKNSLLLQEFSITYNYRGIRMAGVKAYMSCGFSYFDCILFRDNIISVCFNGDYWAEIPGCTRTAMSDALGKGIKEFFDKQPSVVGQVVL